MSNVFRTKVCGTNVLERTGAMQIGDTCCTIRCNGDSNWFGSMFLVMADQFPLKKINLI